MPVDPPVPPAGEEIHLPDGSLQPFLLTIGVTATLVGITVSTILLVAGIVLSVAVLIRWIIDARSELESLPLEHGEH